LNKGGKILIAGFKELRDFYPTLICDNLNAQDLGVEAAAVAINAPAPMAGKMNVTPIELAHAFESADFRRGVIKAVKGSAKGYDRIGFPAVLGLKQHSEVMADLQKGLDRTVFEISTLPPSVPGRRLYELLKQVLIKAGGRLIIGSKIIEGALEDGGVSQIKMETVIRPKTITADTYVLATGGIFGGGIQTDADGQVWESIFGLPVVSETNRHKWFAKDFVSPEGQPVDHFGIRVNSHLSPVDESNTPLAENLFVVGASLAGAEWTRSRTGDGVAVTTAAAAVKAIVG
jgi:glycerol-3-phosphate dehydrogenase subunit B